MVNSSFEAANGNLSELEQGHKDSEQLLDDVTEAEGLYFLFLIFIFYYCWKDFSPKIVVKRLWHTYIHYQIGTKGWLLHVLTTITTGSEGTKLSSVPRLLCLIVALLDSIFIIILPETCGPFLQVNHVDEILDGLNSIEI